MSFFKRMLVRQGVDVTCFCGQSAYTMFKLSAPTLPRTKQHAFALIGQNWDYLCWRLFCTRMITIWRKFDRKSHGVWDKRREKIDAWFNWIQCWIAITVSSFSKDLILILYIRSLVSVDMSFMRNPNCFGFRVLLALVVLWDKNGKFWTTGMDLSENRLQIDVGVSDIFQTRSPRGRKLLNTIHWQWAQFSSFASYI